MQANPISLTGLFMQANSASPSKFRTDINGLRALAVVVVILYHFGIPGFGGGFVGVDVFFVISGFLMTGIVVKGLEQNRFSLVSFYMARARRIFPALVVLCAALLGLGWFVLISPDYKLLGTHTISALGFFSNFKFWDEAGYFDLASHEKWLLHTWSLSVEWQFYLILPVALWAVWQFKPGRSAQTKAVLIGLILSLGASMLTTKSWPTAAFYLLHARAWEMLGGGLVFLLAKPARLSILLRRYIEVVGAILIMSSVFLFDTSSPWPGWRATVPVLGTMLVLAVSNASYWTGNRIAQWLGDRSYSLYLWHWPIYVALVYMDIQRESIAIIGGMLLTLILGNASYLWVESTARVYLGKLKFRSGLAVLCFAAGVTTMFAFIDRQLDGIKGRFLPEVEIAAAEAKNTYPRRKECHALKGSKSPSCVYGGSEWKVIGIGDSHLGTVVTSLAAAQTNEDAGVVQWSYSGCSFVPGMKMINKKLGKDYQCTEFIAWSKEQLDLLPSTVSVVIVNRYASNVFGNNEEHPKNFKPNIYFSKIHTTTTPEFVDEFAHQITKSACELAKRRTVFMVRPIPEMGFDVPKILSRRMAGGLKGDLSISMDDYRNRNQWVWKAQDAARDKCGVKILDPLPYLCRDDRCYGSKEGRPLYVDDDHLSEFGNKLLIPMFAEVFLPKNELKYQLQQ